MILTIGHIVEIAIIVAPCKFSLIVRTSNDSKGNNLCCVSCIVVSCDSEFDRLSSKF